MNRTTHLVARAVSALIGMTLVATLLATAPASALAPTTAPTIVSPNGTDVSANPLLRWDPISGVTKYRVQVAATSSFSPTLWAADTLNVQATPPTELPNGTLYWRVAGMDGSTVGPYASATFQRITVDGPVAISPGDGEVISYPASPVVLRWGAVGGVKSYRVEIDDAPDFIGSTAVTTDANAYALTENQPIGQPFYWRVQGLGTSGNPSTAYSATYDYSLAWAAAGTPLRPVLTTPANNASIADVVLSWNAVPGAARYQLQVSPNGDWANNITFDVTTKGTSYAPATTLLNASYYWRVRALDARSTPNTGNWSEERIFTRSWRPDDPVNEPSSPPLRSPANAAVEVNDLLLQWDPIAFASAYEVNVGTDPNFSPGTFTACTTTHTDYAPYTTEVGTPAGAGGCQINRTRDDIPAATRVYWRVRGLDQPAGSLTPTVLGQWSTVWNFSYLTDAPQPVEPIGTVEVPTLRWTSVDRSLRYEVEVYRNGTRFLSADTYATSLTPNLTVTTTTPLTWRVRSIDWDGRIGPWVEGAGFTLLPNETGTGALTATAPVVDAVVGGQPEFDWTPLTGSTRYEVRLYTPGSSVYTVLYDTNFNATAEAGKPRRSAFTATAPIAPGAYEWSVAAYSGTTQLAATPRRAVTFNPVDDVTTTAPIPAANEVLRATPLMRWNTVEGAAYYRVHVALDPNFTNVQQIYKTTQPYLRPVEAYLDNQAGQSYYWFVQACRADGFCGRFDSTVFGQARSFRKQSRPIALTSPADNASVADQVTFRWQAPSAAWAPGTTDDDVEARTYRLQVSTVPDFASILDQVEIDQRSYTASTKTYPEGPLYWRVQARDGTGNYLTYSTSRRVTKASSPLTVTTPANGATVSGLPVLQWQAQSFAAAYDVEVYKNGDTNWTLSNRVVNTRTGLTAAVPLAALPVGTYAWRVRRVDVDVRPGPWSTGRTFTVSGATPTLVRPANDATFTRDRVLLEWTGQAGAVTYRVETSASAGFASLVESQVTVMTQWAPVKPYPAGTIYWRVLALDARGGVLGTSATGRYARDLTRPAATVTAAVAGPASARITWTATNVAAVGPIRSFTVQSRNGSTLGPSVTTTGTAREAVITGLTNGRPYTFTVTPTDDDGVGSTSSPSAAVTPSKVLPFATVDAFIKQQYLDFYGRAASSGELTFWRNALNGNTSAEGMVATLWSEAPHAGVMPPLTRLYAAYYLRIPDYGGVSYWAGERRRSGGLSIQQVADKFAQTREFVTRYGSLDNTGFVTLVYENVLGRTPSASERTYWVNELNTRRRTRGTVMVGFSESEENRTRTASDITAALVFLEMYRATPTVSERDAISNRLAGGVPLTTIVREILASARYDARV